MMADLDRIRARYNAWYNADPHDFAWEEGCGPEEIWSDILDRADANLHPASYRIESAMAFEIVREDVPALIAEVDRLQYVRVPELTAEIGRLDRARRRVLDARRVLRRANDNLLAELGRMKEENALLKRRIEGLTREEPK